MQQTGNPLDVAINGNAFLAVQTPRGERYTRNGALQINATGQLVTSEGQPVLGRGGPIVFQPNDRNITIGSDGTISVREGANTTDSRAASCARQLRPAAAAREGRHLDLHGADRRHGAGRRADARVMQGAIEKSNVQQRLEMTRMIEVTRTYTQVASMLQHQSDLRRTAIEQARRSPELSGTDRR